MAVNAPYDPTTPVGQIRLLINDTDITDVYFQDSEYNSFLGMVGSNVQLAAAFAYGVIIRSRALLAKYSKREGYESDSHALKDLLQSKADLADQTLTAGGVNTGTLCCDGDKLSSWLPVWTDPNNPYTRVPDDII